MNIVSEHRRLNRLAVYSSAFVLATICLFSTVITLSIENQVMLSAGLLICIAVVYNLRSWTQEFGRILLIALGTCLSLRYWSFRTTATILYSGPLDFTFLMLLYLAETYGIFTHLMGVFVNIVPLRHSALPLPADPTRWPSVDVFVPTYDEPLEILSVTLTACAQLTYPAHKLNIYVLDDGGTNAKGHVFGVGYALAKNTTLATTYFVNNALDEEPDDGYQRLQLDLKVKF